VVKESPDFKNTLKIEMEYGFQIYFFELCKVPQDMKPLRAEYRGAVSQIILYL
jgi:hypothetical protein